MSETYETPRPYSDTYWYPDDALRSEAKRLRLMISNCLDHSPEGQQYYADRLAEKEQVLADTRAELEAAQQMLRKAQIQVESAQAAHASIRVAIERLKRAVSDAHKDALNAQRKHEDAQYSTGGHRQSLESKERALADEMARRGMTV